MVLDKNQYLYLLNLISILYGIVKIIKKTWQGLRSQFMAFMKKLNKSSGSDGKQPFFSHEIGVGFLKGCEAGDIK